MPSSTLRVGKPRPQCGRRRPGRHSHGGPWERGFPPGPLFREHEPNEPRPRNVAFRPEMHRGCGRNPFPERSQLPRPVSPIEANARFPERTQAKECRLMFRNRRREGIRRDETRTRVLQRESPNEPRGHHGGACFAKRTQAKECRVTFRNPRREGQGQHRRRCAFRSSTFSRPRRTAPGVPRPAHWSVSAGSQTGRPRCSLARRASGRPGPWRGPGRVPRGGRSARR